MTTVNPEDLFCKHDLRKGRRFETKIYIHSKGGTKKGKHFVVKRELQEGTRWHLKSISTIDK